MGIYLDKYRLKNYTGKFIPGYTIHNVTVVRGPYRFIEDRSKKPIWLLLCKCGRYTLKPINNYLRKKDPNKSCGCQESKPGGNKGTHHLTKHKLFMVWSDLKRRCNNNKYHGYKNYGGRGIKVCEEWLDKKNGFITFHNWAVANGYQEGLSLDRIDVNGNYEPGNCRWATALMQTNNRRISKKYTLFGEKLTIGEIIEKHDLHIGYETIRHRLKVGYGFYESLFVIPQSRKK